MNRRNFLQTGIGTIVASNVALQGCSMTSETTSRPMLSAAPTRWNQTLTGRTRINLKPVMTNIIHTGVWEGPCRFNVQSPDEETAAAQKLFNEWAAGIKTNGLGLDPEDVNILEPVHITFSEDFVLKPKERIICNIV